MKKIQLWSVDASEGRLTATTVDGVDNTDTEQNLEELLVASPDLLMEGLTLVGRQVPTGGGPLDLLGIDADGRPVVLELKRGTLTRDAVAQVLDYASDLAGLDDSGFATLVEKHSGRLGIDRVDDFADWYRQEHPGVSDLPLDRPRTVLVGLGADDRARRMVDFLAESSVDIQLLTFHAFKSDGKLFLARQVEGRESKPPPLDAPTKDSNLRALHETARSLGVDTLLVQVAAFIEDRVKGYCWPGKQAYSYYLQETTDAGTPTLRSYVALYVDTKERGRLTLAFPPRATKAVEDAVDEFCWQVPRAERNKSRSYALELTFGSADWSTLEGPLDQLLAAIVDGWKRRPSGSGEPAESGPTPTDPRDGA